MKEHYNKEVGKLKGRIAEQAARVEKSIKEAVQAAEGVEASLAKLVVKGDSVIDEEEIRIEEECLKILALYQPVATDLRNIVAILKINSSLERMADHGAHIAKRVIKLAAMAALPGSVQTPDFNPMTTRTLCMLHSAVKVMQSGDPTSAFAIIAKDDAVDAAHTANAALVREQLKQQPAHSGYLIELLGISRDIERIADIATDICEHMIYVTTGTIIRHGHEADIARA